MSPESSGCPRDGRRISPSYPSPQRETSPNKGDVVSSVDVKLEDVYLADAVAANLQGHGYKAESWQTLYPEILKTLAIEQFQNRLIMLLIMIIAAFGIGSVMYMLVNEKTSEIGMFMAMGASGKNIRSIFLMESGILGLMGGVLGGVLGLIVALYLKSLEIKMEAPGGQEISSARGDQCRQLPDNSAGGCRPQRDCRHVSGLEGVPA